MRRIITMLLAAAMLVIAVPIAAGAQSPSIVDIAVGDGEFDNNGGDFDILAAAVVATGLDGALSDGTWTVFAPTDKAFTRLAKLLGLDTSSEEAIFNGLAGALGVDVVTDVLLYHAVPGAAVRFEDVFVPWKQMGEITMANGQTLNYSGVSLIDKNPATPKARLINGLFNIEASNGIIHVIDDVLVPEL